MKYSIQGGQLPVVVCELEHGEGMVTESGGMSWMSEGIAMSTSMDGGLFKGLGRALSGESMFMTYYQAETPGSIAFSSSFPGSIIPVDLQAGQAIICQKRSFLAAQRSVTLSVHFQRKFGAGAFGGEGFIMQRIEGPGLVFVEIDGAAIEYDLAPGQRMKVDTGHLAMMSDTVTVDVTTVKGFKNALFGGEGLFLTAITGPGHVWLQSMPIESVAKGLLPFMPKKS